MKRKNTLPGKARAILIACVLMGSLSAFGHGPPSCLKTLKACVPEANAHTECDSFNAKHGDKIALKIAKGVVKCLKDKTCSPNSHNQENYDACKNKVLDKVLAEDKASSSNAGGTPYLPERKNEAEASSGAN